MGVTSTFLPLLVHSAVALTSLRARFPAMYPAIDISTGSESGRRAMNSRGARSSRGPKDFWRSARSGRECGVLHHYRDKVASLFSLELAKSRRPGQRYPFPSNRPKVPGQTANQLAAALVVIPTSVADIHRDVAKVDESKADLRAQTCQPDTTGLRTMRHRIGYGEDPFCGEHPANLREERQLWHIGQRLDIHCKIDTRVAEWELEGMPMEMSYHGVAVPAVPDRR